MAQEESIPPALQEVFPTGIVAKDIIKIIEKEGIKDFTIDVSLASGKGDNYLGYLHRIHIKGPNEELYLILKTAVRSGLVSEFFAINVTFNREIFMYKDVLNQFAEFQKSKGVTQPNEGFFNYPKIYGYSHEEGTEYLALEDLLQSQFTMHDRQKTLNVQHCELVLKQLARFHACSFAFKDQALGEYSELAKNLPEYGIKNWFLEDTDAKKMEFTKQMNNKDRLESFTALDPEKDQDVINKVKDFYDVIDFEYYQFTCMDKIEKYTVISHGDCWNNNFLFKYADGSRDNPVDIQLLDWQISHITSPVVDVAYFIYLCTDDQLRESHFDRLMDYYYENICSHVKALGSEPEKVFPYKNFRRSLKRYFKLGVLTALNAINVMCCDADDLPDFEKINVSDGESPESLVKNMVIGESQNHKQMYKDRMGGILRHAVKYGFLD